MVLLSMCKALRLMSLGVNQQRCSKRTILLELKLDLEPNVMLSRKNLYGCLLWLQVVSQTIVLMAKKRTCAASLSFASQSFSLSSKTFLQSDEIESFDDLPCNMPSFYELVKTEAPRDFFSWSLPPLQTESGRCSLPEHIGREVAIATRSKDATRGAPGLTRNKDASSFEAIPISNSKKDCLVWRPLLLKVHEGGAAKAVTQWHLGRGHQLELEEQGRAIPEKITELLDWPFCFRCCPLGI